METKRTTGGASRPSTFGTDGKASGSGKEGGQATGNKGAQANSAMRGLFARSRPSALFKSRPAQTSSALLALPRDVLLYLAKFVERDRPALISLYETCLELREHLAPHVQQYALDCSDNVGSLRSFKALLDYGVIAEGTSPGLNVIAALRVAERLGPDTTVVTIMIDSGLRYLSTDVYRDVQ